jgi:hypothetical protein
MNGRPDVSFLCNECNPIYIPDMYQIQCRNCGEYEIVGTFASCLSHKKYDDKKPILSLMVRRFWELNGKRKRYCLNSRNWEELIENYKTISVQDKVNFLFDFIAKNTEPGKYYELSVNHRWITASTEVEQLRYLKEYLGEIKVAQVNDWKVRLTVKGWEEFSKLERKTNSKICFIAMSFTDKIVEKDCDLVIKPLLTELGFDPVVIRDVEYNEDVVLRIISEIQRSRFLIADTRGNKSNIYYEAGYAMGLKKPVIWLCKKGDENNLPFDTRNLSHIVWENIEQLKKKLEERIRFTILSE